MQLHSSISEISRLSDKQKKSLHRLRIATIQDLLYHFPTRYSNLSVVKRINQLTHGETATVYGKILNPKTKKGFRSNVPMGEATLEDLSGDKIKIIWFNQPYIAKMVNHEDTVKLTGAISSGKYGLTMTNPEFEHAPDMPIDNHDSLFTDTNNAAEVFGYPIYPETRGITSKWFYHAIIKVLGSEILDNLIDPLPEHILSKYNLPSLASALVWIHTPRKAQDAEAAKKRFAFQEIFSIQIQKQQDRKAYEALYSYDVSITKSEVQSFIDTFGFTLTNAQQRCIDAIIADVTSDKPMSRLLEGDVGSGKTAVAATVAHAIISNTPAKKSYGNLQVAYMAPTEVLASQLFESFIGYFRNSGIQIALLTGSGAKKFPSKVDPNGWTNISRPQLKKWLKNGEIPILIGTHALISKSLEFKDLALVIIDEQHRFGTNQRMQLAQKQGHAPHYLSMTATPMPRTLALTIYGDLDLSIIDEMPAGRKPVITEIVPPNKRNKKYESVRERLAEGRQVYIICPRIDEPDPEKQTSLQLKSVIAEAKRLKKQVFPDRTIDIMHSKMKKQEKEDVMEKFSRGDIDILVSTSVIEVGVNVPNATVIVIEGAERFGLAQLHQLRGRVIRGTHQAYCYLFADIKTDKTLDRIKALTEAANGFELAEIDMALRGIGDLAGRKQWGMSDLAMEALKNPKLVEIARNEARDLIKQDPMLENFPELATYLKSLDMTIHHE